MSDLPPHPPPGGSRHGEGQPAGGPPSGVPPFGAPPPGGPPPPAGPPPGQGQPRSRTLLVVGLAVVVVAAAGGAYLMSQDGGGEDLPPLPELSAEEQEYADALAGVAREEQGASEDEAACVGAAMVEVIGIDALRDAAAPDNLDAGLTMLRIFGVELPDDRVEELGRRLDRCVDAVAFLLGGSESAPPQVLECIRSSVSEDQVAYALAASYVGSEEAFQTSDDDLRAEAEHCIPGISQD